MDRSLALKASALAKGTRRIPLLVDDESSESIALDDDVIDAEFVELVEPVAIVVAEPVARVTPGRARRATDAYASQPVAPRPIIAIG